MIETIKFKYLLLLNTEKDRNICLFSHIKERNDIYTKYTRNHSKDIIYQKERCLITIRA